MADRRLSTPGSTVHRMFFGVRLPGPFRIGVSSKGRVYGGTSIGPFSVSAPLNSRQRRGRQPAPQVWPVSVEHAVSVAESEGWTVTGRDQQRTLLRKGIKGAEIRAVPGGVTLHRITTNRAILLWIALGVVIVGSCGICVSGGSGSEPPSTPAPARTTAKPVRTTAPPTTPPVSPTPAATTAPTTNPPATTAAPAPPPPAPPALDKRYPSCKEAIAAGLGPYVKGQDPEYAWYRDSDGDGIVCER